MHEVGATGIEEEEEEEESDRIVKSTTNLHLVPRT
jgi:hypothetical protein